MPRIIAGTQKGRRLASVPGDGTRPTSDRVKESLFSRLEGYDALEDAVVVDLYAGSGALGFEALSRGAAHLEAVDLAEGALRTLRKNATAFEGQVTVHKNDALRYLSTREGPEIELLFLDPPYQVSELQLQRVMQAAVRHLHPAATVVVERDAHSGQPHWPSELRCFADRRYGSTHVWWAEPQQT